jgi:hypothetical protein
VRGSLTLAQYAVETAAGLATYGGLHGIAFAIRNPGAAVKGAGWVLALLIGGVLAAYGAQVIYESMTIKGLLFVIVILLVVQTFRER